MPLSSSSSPRFGPRYKGGARGPSFRRERRGPSKVVVVLVLVVLLAAAGSIAFVLHSRAQQRERERLQAAAVQVTVDYLAAWSAGDAGAAAALVAPERREVARTLLAKVRTDMKAVTTSFVPEGEVVSVEPGAGVGYAAKVTVRGLGETAWQGRVPLVREGTSWAVDFTPEVVHPSLSDGGRFAYARTTPTRGKVLLANGTSMADGSAGELASTLRGEVKEAGSDADAAAAGPLFQKGDEIGTSGLQRAFNEKLQGQPGGSLKILDAAGKNVATLLSVKKADGKDITSTLDPKAQQAAQQALAPIRLPRSMVVLDARTGGVLAIAGGSLATTGTYAPGSTFKVVTTVAALANGVGPGTVLDCSATATVNGRTVRNAEGEVFGPLSFATAFAKSCNTWFARLPGKLGEGAQGIEALTKAAELFGFQTGGPTGDSAAAQEAAKGVLPVASFGGTFPRPKDGAQAAGQSFGQDLVLASPLQMASVAGAIASGTWHKPRVTMDTPDVANPLPAGTAETVRGFMAGVVSPGGTAGKVGFPGGVVGKPGTAEVAGQKDNSWFIALRGNVAVACEVTGGGFGADTAAPAVSRFFSLYPG